MSDLQLKNQLLLDLKNTMKNKDIVAKNTIQSLNR